MGYYSNFEGSFTPTETLTPKQHKAIHDWFVNRFGPYEVDKDGGWRSVHSDKGYSGDIYFTPNGEVLPVDLNMKGYYFNEQVYEFVEMTKTLGVQYEGEIARQGEETFDGEMIVVKDGQVKSFIARIDFSHPTVVTHTEKQRREAIEKRIGGTH